jgi:hypothetical protein
MSEPLVLGRVLAGWTAVLGAPTLAVAWLISGRPRPTMSRIQARAAVQTLTVAAWEQAASYIEGWRLAARRGMAARRALAFVISLGLLWRASVHSFVAAVAYPDGPPGDVDHGLVWTPLPMDRVPLWTARIAVAGSGASLAALTGWPEWAFPAAVEWTLRAILIGNLTVWLCEPIAMIRDYVKQ